MVLVVNEHHTAYTIRLYLPLLVPDIEPYPGDHESLHYPSAMESKHFHHTQTTSSSCAVLLSEFL